MSMLMRITCMFLIALFIAFMYLLANCYVAVTCMCPFQTGLIYQELKVKSSFIFFFHLIVSEELCLLQFRRSVKMNFSWCVKLQPINRFYHKVHNTTTVAKDFGNSTSSRLKCNGGKKAQFFFFFFSHNKLS